MSPIADVFMFVTVTPGLETNSQCPKIGGVFVDAFGNGNELPWHTTVELKSKVGTEGSVMVI